MIKRRIAGVMLFVVVASLLPACGRYEEPSGRRSRLVKCVDLGLSPSAGSVTPGPEGTSQRMIAKSAAVSAEVANCDSALSQVQGVITSVGGYVTESTLVVGEGGWKMGSLTARVPAEVFDSTVAALSKSFSKVNSVMIEGTDITDDYYDTVGRLENRRALQASYRGLLKSAGTTKDLLEIQQALANVDDEIDRLEGKRQYLSGQARLASIAVRIAEPVPALASRSSNLWSKVRRGIDSGVAGFGDVLAVTITVVIAAVPAAIVLCLICFLVIQVVRIFRRGRRGQRGARSE